MNWVDVYRRVKAPVRPLVRRHWRNPVLAGAASTARRFLSIYENGSHDMLVNGEALALRRLARLGLGVVLDVGGHEGQWTQQVISASPSAYVHCFEPQPALGDVLEARFGSHPRVTVHRCALGSRSGRAILHVNPRDTALTSLVQGDEPTVDVEVDVRCGDDVLRREGIAEVDFLKVDAEGHDLEVLKGFHDALSSGAVRVVQFEYNLWNIHSRVLLADFYELLDPLGYALGKVHPDGVDFRPYSTAYENWVGPSCIAVRREHPELIDAIAVKGPVPVRRWTDQGATTSS